MIICPEDDDLFIPMIERIEKLERDRINIRASIASVLKSAKYHQGSAALAFPRSSGDDVLASPSVYFIAAPAFGQVKIGFSRNPIKRLASLQTSIGCPLLYLGAILGSRADERAWHSLFAAKRTHDEWFDLDDELKDAIRAALAGWEPLDKIQPLGDELWCLGEDIGDVFAELKLRGHAEKTVRGSLQDRERARCAAVGIAPIGEVNA